MKSVTAAILIKDNKILIAKRKINDKLAGKWEFPGGTIEDGETPEECLKREMKEEFDIDVSVGDSLGESIYHYSQEAIQLLAYRSYWKSGVMEPQAHDEYRWVTIDEIDTYDFAPADIPFVDKIRRKEIEI